jgi:hypothetical protein
MLSRNCHTLASNAETGILQIIDEAGSVSASAEECGSAQETLDLSRMRCHVVMLWFRDAIGSSGSYVGLKDISQAD